MSSISSTYSPWILLVSSFASGCASLYSKPLVSEDSTRTSRGLIYYLPKRTITLTARQRPTVPKSVQEAREARTKALAALATAKTAQEKAEDEAQTARALNRASPSDERRKAQKKALEALTVAKVHTALAKKRYGDAEAKLASAEALVGKELPTYSLSLTMNPLEADRTQAWLTHPHHSVLRDDEETVVVNSQGLLGSAKTESEGKLVEILVEAGRAVAAVVTSAGGGGLESVSGDEPDTRCAFSTGRELTFTRVIDPMTDIDEVNKELQKCFPFRLELTTPGLDSPQTPTPISPTHRKEVPGLVYRPLLPYAVTALECPATFAKVEGEDGTAQSYFVPCSTESEDDRAEFYPVKSALVLLPQGSPQAYIPFHGGSLGRSVTDVTFSDGIVTRWHREDSSEVLDVVKAPVEIVKAVLSAPAEILQLKFNISNKEAEVLKAQLAQQEAEAQLRLVQECIVEAQATTSLPLSDAEEEPAPRNSAVLECFKLAQASESVAE